MTRYVIGPEVPIPLAHEGAVIRPGTQILAPTLFRSQVADQLGWPDTL